MKISKSVLTSVLVAGLSLGMASTAIVTITAGGALAKSEKASAKSEGKGKSEESGSKKPAKEANGKSEDAGTKGRGKVARELKNLNAMCANGKSFEHAAAGSNIGLMKDYQGKLIIADGLRSDFSDLSETLGAEDPDHDADYYLARQDAETINGQIDTLTAERDAALWPNDSDEYQQALEDLAADKGVAVEDLDPADVEALETEHNTGVHDQYDGLIADLGAYNILRDQLEGAEGEENGALLVASKGRGLEGEALDTFQDAMRNGC